MQKWEYFTWVAAENYVDDTKVYAALYEKITMLGDDGWELVTVGGQGKNGDFALFFKRPK